MASPQTNTLNFPHFQPPPPHVTPSPPPSNHTTVVVVVFVSCGGLFFLAFLAIALCCFVKKRNKKTNTQETKIVDVDEHLKVKEAIVQGPHGPQAVVLSVEDDVHVHEAIKKKEQQTYFKSICCFISKKKKKNEIVNMEEHLKVKEEAVLGPHGQEAVAISVEDDVHVEEEVRKSVDKFGHKQPASSSQHNCHN